MPEHRAVVDEQHFVLLAAIARRLLTEELDADEDSALLREMAASLVLASQARAADLIRALHRGLDDPRHLENSDGNPSP